MSPNYIMFIQNYKNNKKTSITMSIDIHLYSLVNENKIQNTLEYIPLHITQFTNAWYVY